MRLQPRLLRAGLLLLLDAAGAVLATLAARRAELVGARWLVAANTLELFDAGGGSLGLFQAAYF